VLVVEKLHVGGREGEHMGPQGNEPHIERNTKESYWKKNAEKAKSTKPSRTLGRLAARCPPHIFLLKLIHLDPFLGFLFTFEVSSNLDLQLC